MRNRILMTAFVFCMAMQPFAIAAELDDHPLITRYPDSKLSRHDGVEFGEYNLVLNVTEAAELEIKKLAVDFGKATLTDESKPALDEAAKLLKDNPELNVCIVGHTDMVGKLVFNLELSRNRAAAVVRALFDDYKIDAGRLEAHGVGPLSPAATNATDEGRARNRRVEIVVR